MNNSGLSQGGLSQFWYPVGQSSALSRGQSWSRQVLGIPIAIFRGENGHVGALDDICPHRGVPLSAGTVTSNTLRCCYHGRVFAADGQCLAVPGRLPMEDLTDAPQARSRACCEQDGLIWVAGDTHMPPYPPYQLPCFGKQGYTTGILEGVMHSRYDRAIDNYADSTHGPFVHTGLGYGDNNKIKTHFSIQKLTSTDGVAPVYGVETTFENQTLPPGLISQIFFATPDAQIKHTERYIAPTLYQVEYLIQDSLHFLVTLVLCPETDEKSRVFKVFSVSSRFPPWLFHWPIRIILATFMRQDITILERQTANLNRFAQGRFAFDRVDATPRAVWQMIRQVEKGIPLADIQVDAVEQAIML